MVGGEKWKNTMKRSSGSTTIKDRSSPLVPRGRLLSRKVRICEGEKTGYECQSIPDTYINLEGE